MSFALSLEDSPIAQRIPWPEQVLQRRKPRGEKPEAAAKARHRSAPLHLNSSLQPNSVPLSARQAAHLLRRTSFGVDPDILKVLIGMPAHEAVDGLMDAALAFSLPDPPAWADAFLPPDGSPESVFTEYFDQQFPWFLELITQWFERMYRGGLPEKLTLFWQNHFVTELETYFLTPIGYRYLALLRTHAFGNFKDFVRAIGLDQAMLIYLNGELNTKVEPNENYARELLELFTMGQYDRQGQQNYTEHDIQELARALTGWWVNPYDFSTNLEPEAFDNEPKEIFGKQGNYDYDGVIDLIFAERSRPIAEFICTKLYEEFVYAAPDDAIVDGLADLFIARDFEIEPVVRALLRSEHFFDEPLIGAHIKSPLSLMIGLFKESAVEELWDEAYEHVQWNGYELDQGVLEQPNVAGWPGYREWISTATLAKRWETVEFYIWWGLVQDNVDLVPLSEKLLNPDDPHLVFKLPAALAEHLIVVPPAELGFEAPQEAFSGDLINHPIPQSVLDGPNYARDLAKIFLRGVPWYEWSLYAEGTRWLLIEYVLYLVRLPEYQLT